MSIALAAAVVVCLACYGSLGRAYWTQINFVSLLVCSALTMRLQWRLRGVRIAHASLREACLVVGEFEQLPRWPWFSAAVALSLAAVYLVAMWGRIPARFPVHFDHAGNANGWSERTFLGVFGPLLIGLGLVVSFYVLQRFQRWFLRRQWSTFSEVIRIRYMLGLRVTTYSSAWWALGSAALAVWLPFADKPDLRLTVTAVVVFLAGIMLIAMFSLRSKN